MAPPEGFHKSGSKINVATFASAFDKVEVVHQPKTAFFKAAQPPRFRLPAQDTLCKASGSGQRAVPIASPVKHHVLVPPVLVQPVQAKSNIGQHAKRTTAITSFQPVIQSHQEDAPKVLPLLQRAPPPVPHSNRPTTPLKPISCPVLPIPTSPKKDLKSIFTTRVARATDPMTDSGHAELLSIFLQDQQTLESASDLELTRGVHASPEKGSRGKGSKYLR